MQLTLIYTIKKVKELINTSHLESFYHLSFSPLDFISNAFG